MNNKLFTFLDPLLGYIDNGRFFREPFRWLYVIFAVLNLLFPIAILVKVIDTGFFKFAEGKAIFYSDIYYPLRWCMGQLSALDEPEKQTERSYPGRQRIHCYPCSIPSDTDSG